jgi:hypothetical protein
VTHWKILSRDSSGMTEENLRVFAFMADVISGYLPTKIQI